MKKVVFISLIALILASCTQFQYVTLDSNIYNSQQRNFVWENDTVRIQYGFSGLNCPLFVNIYNKLNRPLYVDWRKSAIIYDDGSSFSLWNDQANINTGTSGVTVGVGNMAFSTAHTTGTVERADQIGFIPPVSGISATPAYIRSRFITLNKDSLAKSKLQHFDMNGSPFYFRCFLTISTTDNFADAMYIDQPFWASSIFLSGVGPSMKLDDNTFYLQKTTNTGKFLQGVGVASLIVGAAYIDATTPPPPRYHHW